MRRRRARGRTRGRTPARPPARLAQPPAPEMLAHVARRRTADTREAFRQELWNHAAHTIMLAEERIVSRPDAARILRGLAEIERRGPDRFPIEGGTGELLFAVERYLAGRIGEDAASRMHTGRSRGDLYVCVERMVLRERILDTLERLGRVVAVLLRLAARHGDTVMPGYTLLQHAQPSTFAHYLLSFVDRFLRDAERLAETYRRVNRSPMGAAILSGTAFPVNRARMAELLGFDAVIDNTRDASTARDHTLETIAHAAILQSNLGALVEDLILWSTYEFGMVELADGYAGTSSIMPQKKNPSALTRVRHLAAESVGHTVTVFTQLKTHSEELNDFEATGPLVWRSLDTCGAALELTAGLLATLTVKTGRMAALAGANFLQAAHLAETIAQRERIGFRIAHRIVGRLVRGCLARGIAPADVPPEMLTEAALEVTGRRLTMSRNAVREAMDVARILRGRATPGGPGRREVRRMGRERTRALARHRRWLQDRRDHLTRARRTTDRLAARLRR